VSRRKNCIIRVHGSVISPRFLTDYERKNSKERAPCIQMQKTRKYNNATINILSWHHCNNPCESINHEISGVRRKQRWSRKTICHKTRNLKHRYITPEPEWSLKLYSRKLRSTIDRYKNGENAYIYSKQQQQQNQDIALKICICMASDNLCPKSLNNRAPTTDVIRLLIALWVNRSAFNSSPDFPIMEEMMSNHHQLLQ
jgi:hypothetical protein